MTASSQGDAGQSKGRGRMRASRLAKGTFWASVDNWSQQLIQLATFVNVGNLIGPEAVGIMAIVFLFGNLMYSLLVDGFSEVMIQREDLTTEHKEAAFWATAGSGVIGMMLGFLAAYPLAALFGQPMVVPLLQALAPTYALYGVISFYKAKLRRELRFGILALRSVVATGAAAIVAIALAARGYGVWSLVAFHLIWRGLEVLILIVAVRWFPRLRLSIRHLRELLNFGGFSVANNLLWYLSDNLDRHLVGLFLGEYALGLYAMARRLTASLTHAITGIFVTVGMAIFSREQTDRQRYAETVADTVQLSNAIGFPVFGGLAVVAPYLVETFLEPEWMGMVAPLQILCLAAAIQSTAFCVGTAVRAAGRADLIFRRQSLVFVARLFLYTIGIGFGLIGISLANVTAFAIGLPVVVLTLAGVIGISPWRIVRASAPPLWSTIVMMGAVTVVAVAVEGSISAPAVLAVSVVTGAITYGLAVGLTARSVIQTARRRFIYRQA